MARRIVIAGAWLFALVSATGCSRNDEGEEARRRKLLTHEPPRRTVAEVRRELQLFDDQGELLSSGEKVAGLELPKGLTLERQFEHEWYYRTSRVPAKALERYFMQRLMSRTVERRKGAVVFGGAVPRDDIHAPKLKLQVSDLRGPKNASRLYIKQFVTTNPPAPVADVQAQMRELQKYAR